ncbi:MAG: hypothetical protein ACE5JK_04825 [Candidatus Omnitrophota bacterium]
MNKRYRDTAIDLTTHFVLTLALAWFFYRFTGRWDWSLLVVLGGVFIDLDHLIDYFLYFGWKFNLKDFFSHKYLASGRVYVIFHSWELVAIMWAFSFIFSWAIPIASGMTLHLLIDFFFSHRSRPLFLFLFFRWYNRFKLDKVHPELNYRRL